MKTNVYVSNVNSADSKSLEAPVWNFDEKQKKAVKKKIEELNADPSRGAGPDENALLLPRMFDESSACD